MSTLNKLRKAIQEEIKKTLNESGDPKSARNDAFELTKQARSVAGYKAKIPAYEKALAAHQKAASLMKSPLDKKQHLLAAKKLQTDLERFKADMNSGDGAFRSDMKDFGKLKNESFRDDELKRLKIQNKDVDLNLTLAGVQGELAYENGKLRVPGEDKELMNNLDMAVGDIKNDSSEKSKYRKQLLQAWLDGYDAKKEDLESYDESWMEDPKDLDESKNEDPFVDAMELGELAFENGKQRVPAYDKKLMDLIYSGDKEKYNYSSKDLMGAWLDGWDAKEEDDRNAGDLDESKSDKEEYEDFLSKAYSLGKLAKARRASKAPLEDKKLKKMISFLWGYNSSYPRIDLDLKNAWLDGFNDVKDLDEAKEEVRIDSVSGEFVVLVDKSKIRTKKPVNWKLFAAIRREDGTFGIINKQNLQPVGLDESELQEGDQNQGYKVGQKLLWVNRGNVMLCTYKGPEKTGWANVVVVAGDGIFSSRVTSSEIVNLDQLCSVDDADYIIRTNKSK